MLSVDDFFLSISIYWLHKCACLLIITGLSKATLRCFTHQAQLNCVSQHFSRGQLPSIRSLNRPSAIYNTSMSIKQVLYPVLWADGRSYWAQLATHGAVVLTDLLKAGASQICKHNKPMCCRLIPVALTFANFDRMHMYAKVQNVHVHVPTSLDTYTANVYM